MKLTDTLDQILHMLLATNGSSADERNAETPTMTGELEARATAHASASAPPVAAPAIRPEPSDASPGADLARLETTAGVVEKLGLGFHLGSAVERIATAATEGNAGGQKLHEATWLIDRYLELLERRPVGADLHVTMTRLAREGDAIAGLQAIASALGEPTAPPAPAPAFSTALPAAEPEPVPEPPTAPSPLQPLSFRRELALTGARAVIVIAAVVIVVLVLTLISQWR